MAKIRTVRDASPRFWMYVAAGIVAIILLFVIGWFYLATEPSPVATDTPRLEGALRAGSPEFEQYRERIVIGAPRAIEAPRALGDMVVELNAAVSNSTGRAINGIELRGAVLDPQGNVIRERTIVPVPSQQSRLAPGETMDARILLEGVDPNTTRAGVRVEVTGVRFE